jgi:hypothetical protein
VSISEDRCGEEEGVAGVQELQNGMKPQAKAGLALDNIPRAPRL